ncbi:hypothetical protein DSECCO2_234200 [anaerobic digester metagenome]
MGNAHQVVVHHIGKVIGGQPVGLDEYLIVQRVIVHGDVSEGHVVEGGFAFPGNLLANDEGLACVQIGLNFLLRQTGAAPVILVNGYALCHIFFGSVILAAEATISKALFYQQLGVLSVQIPALRLDIGAYGAAHVGAFVVIQSALRHGLVDHVGGVLYQTALIGVLNAQDERTSRVAGNEPGVQRGA